jgi:hypothetical protein
MFLFSQKKRYLTVAFLSVLSFGLGSRSVLAQTRPAQRGYVATRPGPAAPLFLRIDWQTVPGLPLEHPVDQRAVSNPDLELNLYGPAGKDIQENGDPNSASNPLHVWTGLCAQPCALAFRHKRNNVDLTGMAKIRWVTKVGGLHQVHPILKLANGPWILGKHGDGTILDYHVAEFTLSETRWIELDIDKVVTRGRWLEKPDLSSVAEVGFTDLMPGSGHGDGGYSDVGSIEVYGQAIPVSTEHGTQ